MEVLFLIIPISLALVFLAIWIFFRMADSGQFDDMEGPAYRILLDDDMSAQTDESGRADSASTRQGDTN